MSAVAREFTSTHSRSNRRGRTPRRPKLNYQTISLFVASFSVFAVMLLAILVD